VVVALAVLVTQVPVTLRAMVPLGAARLSLALHLAEGAGLIAQEMELLVGAVVRLTVQQVLVTTHPATQMV
jgi:chemotaxis receptor (MCP) glutamine deamidase CheD